MTVYLKREKHLFVNIVSKSSLQLFSASDIIFVCIGKRKLLLCTLVGVVTIYKKVLTDSSNITAKVTLVNRKQGYLQTTKISV